MKNFSQISKACCLSGLLFIWSFGCTPGLELRLAPGEQHLPTPAFQVRDPEHPDTPRYESISLYERQGADASSDVLVWKVISREKGDLHGISGFSYGLTPDGFEQTTAPALLEAGKTYILVLAGSGYATLAFQADTQGIVQRVSLR